MDWFSFGVGFLSGLFLGSNLVILVLGLCRIGAEKGLRPHGASPFSHDNEFQEKKAACR